MNSNSLSIVKSGNQRKNVEDFGEVRQQRFILVLLLDLIEESIDFTNLSAFVISSQDRESVGVKDLEAQKSGEDFDAFCSSVHIVACEHVLLAVEAQGVEDVKQVFELAVDVADDVDRSGDLYDVRLFLDDCPCLIEQCDELIFGRQLASLDIVDNGLDTV